MANPVLVSQQDGQLIKFEVLNLCLFQVKMELIYERESI